MNKKKVNNKYYIQTELIRATDDARSFQDAINEFAKTHAVIGIKYQSFCDQWHIYDRALIMYKVWADKTEVGE